MREIKFEYGFESVNGFVKKKYFLHEMPNIKEKCDVWDDLPIAYVREYTGLDDKNGKEIYKGDKLNKKTTFNNNMADKRFQSHTEITVGFRNGMFINEDTGVSLVESLLSISSFKKEYWTEYEIIGNIHEDPDKLE